MLDLRLAADERTDAILERTIGLREARVLAQVLSPRIHHECLHVSTQT
jgi:hypothetical protein